MTASVAILLSGRGSNFLSLHRAMEAGEVPARIVLVLSNVEGAPGLDKARELGLPAQAIPHRGASYRGMKGRKAHEARVLEALERSGAEWICLAGYMRLLSPEFIRRYPQRILNIHPSLLPAFPGLAAQGQALEHGVRVSGCTVHLVDEGLDSGPIVVQRAVPVLDDDDEEALSQRILGQEHQAYAAALGLLLTRRWTVEGRRLVFSSASQGALDEKDSDGG
ncbi:MAG: phosphoribosylglycinamide formyltransferase [Acidobacteriota bacterium]|nr:phosphoribosylglycinamide formyltransferase [Acidobacteriota bacterium]